MFQESRVLPKVVLRYTVARYFCVCPYAKIFWKNIYAIRTFPRIAYVRIRILYVKFVYMRAYIRKNPVCVYTRVLHMGRRRYIYYLLVLSVKSQVGIKNLQLDFGGGIQRQGTQATSNQPAHSDDSHQPPTQS